MWSPNTCPSLRLSASLVLAATLVAVGDAKCQEPPLLEWVQAYPGVFLARSNTPVGNPSTLVVTGPDATVIVDPNLPRVEEDLRSFLGDRSASSEVPIYIASTHAHGDHAGGLVWSASVGQVVGTQANRMRLAGPRIVEGEKPLPEGALPTLLFADSIRLQVAPDLSVKLFSPRVPGHTDGDLMAYVPEARLLYAGDYLFLDRLPIIDAEEGGTLEGYLATVHRLASTLPSDTRVYAGHGTFGREPIRTVPLAEWRAWAGEVLDAARVVWGAMEEGLPRDSIVARGPPERFAHLVRRPRYLGWDRWVDQILDLRAADQGTGAGGSLSHLMAAISRSGHPVFTPGTHELTPSLVDAWDASRFVSVGEWHGFGNTWGVLERIATDGHPFDLVGLEVGQYTGALLDSLARQNPDARSAMLERYPFAVPFYWWSEPWTAVAGLARRHQAHLFGFDREFAWSARMHFSTMEEASRTAADVAPWARRAEESWKRYLAGDGEPLMMAPAMDSLGVLAQQLEAAGGTEAAARLEALRASSQIDRSFRTDPFGSNLARTRLAQRRVADAMESYRVDHGSLPRLLTVSGLMHAPRGVNFIGLGDVGTLTATAAAAHGETSLHVLVLPVRGQADASGPQGARVVPFDAIPALDRYFDLSPFVAQVGDTPMYFDLASLRSEAIRVRRGAAEPIVRLVESFDALILIPQGTPATLSQGARSRRTGGEGR